MSARARTGHTPWARDDVVFTALLIAIGVVLWTIGWYRVSGRTAMDEQVAPFDLAAFGVAVVGAGQARWFVSGRRAVAARRRVLIGSDAVRVATPQRVPHRDELFCGSERFFHRLECPMVLDRTWPPASRSAQEQAGRVPCGVCSP
jgi:hypothetical protein